MVSLVSHHALNQRDVLVYQQSGKAAGILWDGAAPMAWIFLGAIIVFPVMRLVLGDNFLVPLNAGIGIFIFATCAAMCGLVVLKSEGVLFTSLPWYYLTLAVFFGFGELAYYFSALPTQMYIQESSHYIIDENGIFESNMVNLIGIFVSALGMILARMLYPAVSVYSHDIMSSGRRERVTFYIFVAVGLTVKLGLTLPALLGNTVIVLPSLLKQLELLLPAALMIGVMLVRAGASDLRPALYACIGFEVLMSFTLASKSQIVMTILLLIVADYVTRPRPLRSLVFGGFLFGLYSLILAPLVLFMRGFYASAGEKNVDNAWLALSEFWQNGDTSATGADGVQLWWARLSYNNYQKFGIDQFDTGHPGTSLNEMFFILVPRIFFPDKPVLNSGKELSDLLYPGSSEWVQTGMSVFGEGYWNLGYPGVLFVAFWMGISMYLLSSFVTRQLVQGRLGMLFVAVGCMQVGMLITGAFAGTYVGGIALILVYAAAVKVTLYLGHKRARQ